MGAGIFGLDTVSSPPAVTLPGPDQWFDDNVTPGTGTQVPDYWLNKQGAEIENAILLLAAALGFGSLTYSVTTRNQLGTLLAGLAVAVLQVQPVFGSQEVPTAAANTSYSFTLTMVAPRNGFINALSITSSGTPLAVGATLASTITLSGAGVTNINAQSGNSAGPQAEFANCAISGGSTLTAVFSTQTNSVPPATQFAQVGNLAFH
jgi:hypothetical protein